MTPGQWRLHLAEYDDGHHSSAPARAWSHLTGQTRWLGRAPASEQRLGEAERRLGARLPPSLRGFLMVSNGWGSSSGSGWMPAISSCEEIDWFRNTHREFIAAYCQSGVRAGDDLLLNALSLARGEDTILLDTRSLSAEGEYEAYVFAVAFGHLDEPCASFGELIAKSRARSEHIRSLLGGN